MKDKQNVEDLLPDEEDSNIHHICKDCAAYHRKLFQESGAEPDIGDMVKVSFTEREDTEHMWAEIIEITEDGDIFGTLANVPIVLKHLQYGQSVVFKPEQIMIYTSKNWPQEKQFQHIVDVMKKVQNRHHEERRDESK